MGVVIRGGLHQAPRWVLLSWLIWAVLSVGWRRDRQLPERRAAEPQISAIVSSVQGRRPPRPHVTPERDR
jgi:hypothetical protein